MKLLSLSLENFMGFADLQTLNLADRGLLCVLGNNKDNNSADSNGSGKSSVLEAIVFALYGKLIRPDFAVNEIPNNKTKKDCTVALDFEDSGNVYKVTRVKPRNKKKPLETTLTINGQPSSLGTSQDTQQLINTVVGMDYKTFLQAVLLTSNGQRFCSLTDKEQKAILEDILHIEVFVGAQKLIRDKVKELENQQFILNSEITNKNNMLNGYTAQRFHAEKQYTSYETIKRSEIDQLQEEKNRLQQVPISSTLSSKSIESELKKLDSQASQINKELATKSQEVALELAKLLKDRPALSRKLGKVEAEINAANTLAGNFNSLANVSCPTCLRHVDADYAEEILAKCDRLIKSHRTQQEALGQHLEELGVQEHQIQQELLLYRQEVNAELSKLDVIKRQTWDQLQRSRQEEILLEQNKGFLIQIDHNLERLRKELLNNPHVGTIEELDKSIASINDSLYNLNQRVDEHKEELKYLAFWDKGFGNQGVKNFAISQVLPFLNDRIKFYASLLSGGDLEVELSAKTTLASGEDRDKLSISVKNKHGAELYAGNSDGEKCKVDVAIGWALGDLAASKARKAIKFRGIDEIFGPLDPSGEDAVIRLLNKVTPRFETILLITHKDYLKTQIDNYITVVKENDTARIEEGP